MYEKSLQSLENSYLGSNTNSTSYIAAFNNQQTNPNAIAPVTGKYVFQLDSVNNLIENTTSIANGDTTNITITVSLKGGISYAFSATATAGNWSNVNKVTLTTTGIESITLSDDELNTFKNNMFDKQPWSFTAPTTGSYQLQLTINDSMTLSNLKISESITCSTYLAQGTITKTNTDKLTIDFIPSLCNEYEYIWNYGQDISPNTAMTLTLKEIYSFERED